VVFINHDELVYVLVLMPVLWSVRVVFINHDELVYVLVLMPVLWSVRVVFINHDELVYVLVLMPVLYLICFTTSGNSLFRCVISLGKNKHYVIFLLFVVLTRNSLSNSIYH
jgi:hypothetical protein